VSAGTGIDGYGYGSEKFTQGLPVSFTKHAKREKEKSAVASAAYASKQAEMYARLARDAQVVQEKAENKRVIYQQWYANFIYTPLFELIRLFSFMQDGISTLNQSVDIML
jgi:hypothetical protein